MVRHLQGAHAGTILDAAGQKKDAGKRLEHAHQLDATALRVVQAYGSYLSRNGSKDDALKNFKAFDEVLPHHPLITDAIADINAGKKLPILVDSPQAGAAEVLYGLGAALGRRGGEDLGLIYLQPGRSGCLAPAKLLCWRIPARGLQEARARHQDL